MEVNSLSEINFGYCFLLSLYPCLHYGLYHYYWLLNCCCSELQVLVFQCRYILCSLCAYKVQCNWDLKALCKPLFLAEPLQGRELYLSPFCKWETETQGSENEMASTGQQTNLVGELRLQSRYTLNLYLVLLTAVPVQWVTLLLSIFVSLFRK